MCSDKCNLICNDTVNLRIKGRIQFSQLSFLLIICFFKFSSYTVGKFLHPNCIFRIVDKYRHRFIQNAFGILNKLWLLYFQFLPCKAENCGNLVANFFQSVCCLNHLACLRPIANTNFFFIFLCVLVVILHVNNNRDNPIFYIRPYLFLCNCSTKKTVTLGNSQNKMESN